MNYLLKYYFENELGKMLQFFSGFSIEWISIYYYGKDLTFNTDEWSIEVKFKYTSLLYTNYVYVYELYSEKDYDELTKENLEGVINSISNKLASIEKEFRRKEAEINAKED